jgi:2-polyprenyl-6-methoxyphenol hydroxylase-like FAD-dependent oxidoreductase
LWCKKWFYKNSVLIGDSAHTAHFSVGSGTRLAMEDAIALVKAIRKESVLTEALEAYQEARQPIAQKIVEAANTSAKWYETFSSKMEMLPLDLGFDYITRSGRVDLERLRSLSPNFMKAYETRNLSL